MRIDTKKAIAFAIDNNDAGVAGLVDDAMRQNGYKRRDLNEVIEAVRPGMVPEFDELLYECDMNPDLVDEVDVWILPFIKVKR